LTELSQAKVLDHRPVPSPQWEGAPGTRPALSIGFIPLDNFTLSTLSLFIDGLRQAADDGDHRRRMLCRWTVMAPRPSPIPSSCGIGVSRSSGFVHPGHFDYIVIVGGVPHTGQCADDETVRYLQFAARERVKLVTIGSGSFVLGLAGLMSGRRCCVSWYHYQDFRHEFPTLDVVADRLFVTDGDPITCSGAGGAADLATSLIEHHIGRAAAQRSRHVLLLDTARGGDALQPHPPLVRRVADERVRRATLLMEQHKSQPLPIGEIAARLHLSMRQLERLFQTLLGIRPAAYYRDLRLRYAHWLLANTDRSVTNIAVDAGYSDCAHFSRQFKAAYGRNPSGLRPRRTVPDQGLSGAGEGRREGRIAASVRSDHPPDLPSGSSTG
jgi:transcriptional regulator GlxA family with amidase domain